MKTEQRNQIKKLNSALPELNNCDMIINRWAKELMTLFPDRLNKDWYKDDEQHWHLGARTANGTNRKILVSHNFGIINSSDVKLDADTVIFVSQAKSDEAVMFFWGNRNNPYEYVKLFKNDKNSFIKKNKDAETVEQYRQFKSEKTLRNGNVIFAYDELRNFYNMSLVASCLSRTRKNGTQKSNQNSQAQSARGTKKAGKIVNCKSVKMAFDSADHEPKTENKTVLDAYRIVAGKYGYKKSLRQFHRDLAKGEELKFIGNGCFSVYCTLMTMSSNPLKINISIDFKKPDLNLNDNCILSGLNDIEHAQRTINEKPELRSYEQEWLDLCKSWDNDPEMCWSYEWYINKFYKQAA